MSHHVDKFPACRHKNVLEMGIFLEQDKSEGYNPFSEEALRFMCLQYNSFESTVEKGEIALNEQFLLFPQFSTFLRTMSHLHQI